ncbi:MAG: GTPase [Thermoprotei archaeon]
MKPDVLRQYYIKTYEELFRVIDHRLRTASIPLPSKRRKPILVLRNILLAKLGTVYNIIISEVNRIIEALNTVNNMQDFYKEIFKLETGKKPDELLPVFRKILRNANKIYREYHDLVKNSTEKKDMIKYFRSGIGRLLSLYKRKRRVIESIKKALTELSKLPDVTGDYTVIIAGVPQVGKSTLISKLTRAKPEISPFPFTTKTVIVGHINVEPHGKITLVDTPGILDRPVNEKNPIELKAVLAIRYLADTVLYLFDVNPQSYYSFEEQVNVFKSVIKWLGEREIIPIINKVDITPEEVLKEKSEFIEREYGVKPLYISSLKGYNIDRLREILINKFMEKTLRH